MLKLMGTRSQGDATSGKKSHKCAAWKQRIALVLMVGAVAGPMQGCAEVVQFAAAAAVTAYFVSFTYREVQSIRSATLDVERQQLEIQVIKNGLNDRRYETLTGNQVAQILKDRKVEIETSRGKVNVPVFTAL